MYIIFSRIHVFICPVTFLPQTAGMSAIPNQKNIYGAALALIAIMYGSMQGIIAVASLLATMHNPGNGMDP